LDDVGERGYWLPVDAQAGTPINWLSHATISEMLKSIEAKHVLVIADSCYTGILTRDITAVKLLEGPERDTRLAILAEKRARTVLISGGLEPATDLLLMDGKSCPEVARWLYRDEETIRAWVHAFNEAGLHGLERAAIPGRPT
jgi:hypothetical protein